MHIMHTSRRQPGEHIKFRWEELINLGDEYGKKGRV